MMRILKCASITMLILSLAACNATLNDSTTAAMGDPLNDRGGEGSMEASVPGLDAALEISDRGSIAAEFDVGSSPDMLINVADAAASMGTFTLTFRVQMPPEYLGEVTIGNSLDGWERAGAVQLIDDDGDSVYLGQMQVPSGLSLEFRFIQGFDGSGLWESVPPACGLVTAEVVNRLVTMPAADLILPVMPFGGCPNQQELSPIELPGVAGNCDPEQRLVTFRLDASGTDFTAANPPCVFGNFNDWSAQGNPMNAVGQDGVFELSVLTSTQAIEFKYRACSGGMDERFSATAACTRTDGIYTNRLLSAGDSDVYLGQVCFNSCTNCNGEPVEDASDPPTVCNAAPGRIPAIRIQDRSLYEGERPMHLKGVAWQPYGIGEAPTGGEPDWAGNVEVDTALMLSAGINTVRTYGPISDRTVLDRLHELGIGVIMTVFYGYEDTVHSTIDKVCALKDHPAILSWSVGNEWNLNRLGRDVDFREASVTVERVVRAIRRNDPSRPVNTVYGGMPDASLLSCLDEAQFWGLNIYSGPSFNDLFANWRASSGHPMFLAEYGADAYNTAAQEEDEDYQAFVVRALTQEIHENSVISGGVCSGGMVFELHDEWWKAPGRRDQQDTEANWQNGAYADPGIQEEWWGLVRIDRTPRAALEAYGELSVPTAP